MGDWWPTVWVIVVMLAVILGAYYTTKYVSSKGNRLMRGKHIKVVDRMAVARDKQIILVEVADKYLLVGVTNQAVNVLETFDKEELSNIQEQEKTNKASGQKSIFGKVQDFVATAKSANANFQKARTQYKNDRKNGASSEEFNADFLTKMSDAIEQRKKRQDHVDEEDT